MTKNNKNEENKTNKQPNKQKQAQHITAVVYNTGGDAIIQLI